jgi:hypothetical protein
MGEGDAHVPDFRWARHGPDEVAAATSRALAEQRAKTSKAAVVVAASGAPVIASR